MHRCATRNSANRGYQHEFSTIDKRRLGQRRIAALLRCVNVVVREIFRIAIYTSFPNLGPDEIWIDSKACLLLSILTELSRWRILPVSITCSAQCSVPSFVVPPSFEH